MIFYYPIDADGRILTLDVPNSMEFGILNKIIHKKKKNIWKEVVWQSSKEYQHKKSLIASRSLWCCKSNQG